MDRQSCNMMSQWESQRQTFVVDNFSLHRVAPKPRRAIRFRFRCLKEFLLSYCYVKTYIPSHEDTYWQRQSQAQPIVVEETPVSLNSSFVKHQDQHSTNDTSICNNIDADSDDESRADEILDCLDDVVFQAKYPDSCCEADSGYTSSTSSYTIFPHDNDDDILSLLRLIEDSNDNDESEDLVEETCEDEIGKISTVSDDDVTRLVSDSIPVIRYVNEQEEEISSDADEDNDDIAVVTHLAELDSQSLPGLQDLDVAVYDEAIDFSSIDCPKMSRKDLDIVINDTLGNIGRGATSKVSLRRLHANDFLVAVKQLYPTESKSTLVNEINALRKLENCLTFPQLLGVIDEKDPSLVMEFVGDWQTMTSTSVGEALNSFTPRLSTAEWLAVGRDVAQGLATLHHHGFVHGDLHDDNIMLCRYSRFRDPLERWQAKIIDLGFSESIDAPTAPLQLTDRQKVQWRGCFPFKAPELIEGSTGHTPATDIYAYGHIMNKIGNVCGVEILSSLGKKCMDTDPEQRGDLRVIARELAMQVFRHQSV